MPKFGKINPILNTGKTHSIFSNYQLLLTVLSYSGIYYNLEVFHMREKQIPVDSVEIKETIQAFAWEPVGNKFAVIHGEPPSTSVSFYEVKTGQTPTLVKKYERKPCNQLYWAPSGKNHVFLYIVRFTSFECYSNRSIYRTCGPPCYVWYPGIC